MRLSDYCLLYCHHIIVINYQMLITVSGVFLQVSFGIPGIGIQESIKQEVAYTAIKVYR